MASRHKRKILRAAHKRRSKTASKPRSKPTTRKDDKVTSKKDEPDPQPQMREKDQPKRRETQPEQKEQEMPKQKVDAGEYPSGTVTYLGEIGGRPPVDASYLPSVDIGGVTFKQGVPAPVQLLPPGLADQLSKDERFVLGTRED